MENKVVRVDVHVPIKFGPSISKDKTIKLKRPVLPGFKISSPFGWRNNPNKPTEKQFHGGVDFACPVGTEVYAMADGVVDDAGWVYPENHNKDFGLRIRQKIQIEGFTYYLWYGHLSELQIKPLEQLKEGQLIALSGESGNSKGAHLHVQCRKKDSNELYDMEFYD